MLTWVNPRLFCLLKRLPGPSQSPGHSLSAVKNQAIISGKTPQLLVYKWLYHVLYIFLLRGCVALQLAPCAAVLSVAQRALWAGCQKVDRSFGPSLFSAPGPTCTWNNTRLDLHTASMHVLQLKFHLKKKKFDPSNITECYPCNMASIRFICRVTILNSRGVQKF